MDICRVCMEEVENYSSIFDCLETKKKALTPAMLIRVCCGTSISRNDGLPELVCSSCLSAIVQAYMIREKCIASDRKLRKIVFFRNPAPHLTEPKDETDKSRKQATPVETTDGSEERLEILHGKDQHNDLTLSKTDMVNGSDHFNHDLVSVASSIIVCDVKDYEEQDVEEIKKEREEVKETCFDEEFLSEDVPELNKPNNQSVPYADTTLLMDNQTIAMRVEIINQPKRIRANAKKADDANELRTNKHVCELCRQEFTTKGNLNAHIKLHNNERPYCCHLCGRDFSKKSNLKVHLNRHSNVRTHQCTMCDKSFVCHINLKSHMKKHKGERPYECQYCKKSFMYLSDLRRHRFLHTGDFPFSCEICGKHFNRASNLIRHQKSKCKKREDKK